MSQQFGKYFLQRKLAEGGMAEVFLAKQSGMEGFEKPVVVKRILPHLCFEESFVQMFLNEARVAARLSHPSIVQIFDLGKVEDQYYIAMEFIHGEDLRMIAKQAEKKGQRPSFALIARIIADMLGALHYAHTRSGADGKPLGLVHRDISPQNVLVTYDGGIKLVDFGIAKATEAQTNQQTQAGLLKGKYAYMSPEQCRGKKLDARSDIFSVGILLWELVTWRRLFRRDNDLATLVAVADEPIPRLASIRSDVPPELDAICAKALERSLDTRYPTGQAMQADLEAVIRKYAWEADSISLQRYLRQCFAEKLDAQDEAMRAAGVGSLEDFLVKIDDAPMAWLDQRSMLPSINVTPGVAMPFRDLSGPHPRVPQVTPQPSSQSPLQIAPVPAPRPLTASGGFTRSQVLPQNPMTAGLGAPTGPMAAARPLSGTGAYAREEMTPSTMRHAVGQAVPRSMDRTPPSVAARKKPSGAKRVLLVGGTGILLGAAVLFAVFWPDVHSQPHHGVIDADPAAVATLRVELDQPAEIFVDGALQPPGKEAELSVSAGKPHEVVVRHGKDPQQKVAVPALDAGSAKTVKIKIASSK